MAKGGKSTVETIEIDKGYAKLVRELRQNVKGSFVEVGIFGGQNPSKESILMYAIVNEFGYLIKNPRSGGAVIIIPERPFMRSTINKNRQRYASMIDAGFHRIALGNDTAKGVLTRLGITIRNDLVRTIKDFKTPSNAPSTIDRKGVDNPLIESRAMSKAITWKLGKTYTGGRP